MNYLSVYNYTRSRHDVVGHDVFDVLHLFQGDSNTFFFGPLAGVTPMTHVDDFQKAWNVLSDAEKILNGKLPKSHP